MRDRISVSELAQQPRGRVAHGWQDDWATTSESALSQLLYCADRPWVDFTDPLLTQVHAGHAVMWVSFSRSVQFFALVDGHLIRIRQAPEGAHLMGDGLPVLIEPPLIATACGCGDASGYRSTPPLLVAVVDHPEKADQEMGELVAQARAVGRQLVEAGYDRDPVPAGHPPDPCGALYCPASPPTSETAGG